MKYAIVCLAVMAIFFSLPGIGHAVTVYFKDGTQLEVEKITRIGDTVCLFIDISRIDTIRTRIDEPAVPSKIPQKGLVLTDVDFAPSDDNTEIIATGNVINQTEQTVQRIQVTVTLMDKEENVLLKVNGYVRPDSLSTGQKGSYAFRVSKPKGFWKASVDVKADVVQ